MEIDEKQLLLLVQRLSQEYFGRPFEGNARWNRRLRTSAGRYVHQNRLIEINPRYIAHFGEAALVDTIKHELIHHYFPSAGHGPMFQREAERIGCSRHCSSLPGERLTHSYACTNCDRKFKRRRRFDTARFRCGHCRGQLRYLQSTRERC